MNKERRKQIAEAADMLDRAHFILDSCANAERDYYDNMHENFQQSEKGQVASEAADALESARDSVQEAIDSLGNIQVD